MAEIELFATQEEIVDLVKWLVDRKCKFIPDLKYETSSLDRIADPQILQNLAQSVSQFYVVRDDLIESPLEVREVNRNDEHFFYVNPRTGGPTLAFWWGRQFERDARLHLSGTELSYYPWYENSISRIREKPSKAFREMYSEFAKASRQSRRMIKPGKREFWISPNIETLVEAGAILVGLETYTVHQILGVLSRNVRNGSHLRGPNQ